MGTFWSRRHASKGGFSGVVLTVESFSTELRLPTRFPVTQKVYLTLDMFGENFGAVWLAQKAGPEC